MNIIIRNKIFGVYGPNVAAEQITSSTHATTATSQGLASVCMKDIDARFHERIKNGSIMAAAQNFDCSSSREQASRTLKLPGVELVIIDSSTRIFFRNAINIGLPIAECADICGFCRMEGELRADLPKGVTRNITQRTETKDMMSPDFLLDIVAAGGLLNKLRAGIEGEQDEGSEDRTAREDYIRSKR